MSKVKRIGAHVPRYIMSALLAAEKAISEEVSAGDVDHPMIRGHASALKKVRAAIAKAQGGEA